MNERRTDLLKLKKSIGKVSSKDLGKLFKQYYNKHITPVEREEVYKEAVKVFNGGLL